MTVPKNLCKYSSGAKADSVLSSLSKMHWNVKFIYFYLLVIKTPTGHREQYTHSLFL